MKRWLLGLCCVLLSGAALAAVSKGVRKSVRKSVQVSMQVTGNIAVAPQGTVSEYTIDHPEQLPALVRDLIDSVLPGWTFEPIVVDGKPAAAKSSMTIRLVGTPTGEPRSYTIRIASVVFSDSGNGGGRSPRGVA